MILSLKINILINSNNHNIHNTSTIKKSRIYKILKFV